MIISRHKKNVESKIHLKPPVVFQTTVRELTCLYSQEQSTVGEVIDIEIRYLQIEAAQIRKKLQQCSHAQIFHHLTDELNEVEQCICILLQKLDDDNTFK